MLKMFSTLLVVLGFVITAQSIATADPTAGGTINGTVRGPNGQVVSGVEVKLFAAHHRGAQHPATQEAEAGKKHHKGPASLQSATTDSNGHFSFTGLDAGEYQVVAGGKGEGHGHARLGIAANGTGTANISLTAPHPRKKAG